MSKKKAKRLRGSPEVLRFRGKLLFSLLEALAQAAPSVRMQLQALLPQQHQQHQQQQQQQQQVLQQQLSQQQQEVDLEQLRHFLHLLGRLADELKASKPKDYRFLWTPELLQPQPQYNPTGYPLSTLLHARSLAAAAAAAAGAAAAAAAAADAAAAEEETSVEGVLGAGAGEAEPAAAAALRERKALPDSAAATAATAAAGGGDPDSSSSSCCCCTFLDGVCLSLPVQMGEACASFLEAFRSSSTAALELAASGVSSDFSGGLVGFLSILKERLKEVDDVWREAEEELLKALFAAANQQQKHLKALLEAEAQVSECEAQEEFAAKRKAEESFVLRLLELMETIQPGWKDSGIPKDAIELAETVIFYRLRLSSQHVDLCSRVIRLYLRARSVLRETAISRTKLDLKQDKKLVVALEHLLQAVSKALPCFSDALQHPQVNNNNYMEALRCLLRLQNSICTCAFDSQLPQAPAFWLVRNGLTTSPPQVYPPTLQLAAASS